ncbi:DUF4198 domain-containing protein [Sphingomonas soli]|uniref:DUF4198 domain-containing protein n=1 Tax=Sphingomonas soli TaxID=266127 RepID=UPI00082A9312|nr:DUF4198 domain-containing protein [Sphingomonas soli]
MNLRNPMIAIAALAVVAAPAAYAHRAWLLPSSTIVSGTDNYVTVDAAASNEVFFFDHRPLVQIPTVFQPDGTEGKIENHAVGKFRATFDLHLTQQGTYRLSILNEGVVGSYKLNGETKQLPRGTTAATLAAAIPAGATDVTTSESIGRNETFITQGAPTNTVFKTSGRGIELVPVTHPNDLIVGEPATFQFMTDGKPGANLKVTAIQGGIRYRDALNPIDLKTDAQGKVVINWPGPGMYWLNVTPEGAPAAPGQPQRRLAYITTLEVLAP